MYTVSDEPWPESFGNHRAVLHEGNEEAVHIVIPWRRHDPDPQDRMLLLISAESNDTVPNIHRIRVDRESCEIFAGPVRMRDEIPFGLMGDMLHGGGNPWLGMVFGMTTRLPWSTEGVLCNPVAIWKIWDEFGIEQSCMSGPWDLYPAVETDHPDVKATAYIKENRVLIQPRKGYLLYLAG